jgi:hypothetical protein
MRLLVRAGAQALTERTLDAAYAEFAAEVATHDNADEAKEARRRHIARAEAPR